jgi:hypothetical protein
MAASRTATPERDARRGVQHLDRQHDSTQGAHKCRGRRADVCDSSASALASLLAVIEMIQKRDGGAAPRHTGAVASNARRPGLRLHRPTKPRSASRLRDGMQSRRFAPLYHRSHVSHLSAFKEFEPEPEVEPEP